MSQRRYRLRVTRSAARAIAHTLPEKVAVAVHELLTGALLDDPHRVGKPLDPPLAPQWSARRGTYRVIYLIIETEKVVEVTAVRHPLMPTEADLAHHGGWPHRADWMSYPGGFTASPAQPGPAR